jgi:hypothetical protein
VDQSNATQIRSRRKTGYIADNAAANCDNQRFAIRSRTTERADDLFHAAKMLRGLRIIKKMHAVSTREPQSALDDFAYGAPNLGRGNNMNARKISKRCYFLR